MRLGVNIDHVATVRQARKAREPEPVAAAILAELAGAEGITVHLRGDRRHIQERDLEILREVVSTKVNVEMAASREMLMIAARVKPGQVTLVPERPHELTTAGGLDVVRHADVLKRAIARLGRAGVKTSLFIDADGTAQRESMRRYFSLTVEPLAGLLSAELSVKLEADISLGFSGRFAADLSGRARAFQSMINGGLDVAKAAGLAGLMEVE